MLVQWLHTYEEKKNKFHTESMQTKIPDNDAIIKILY